MHKVKAELHSRGWEGGQWVSEQPRRAHLGLELGDFHKAGQENPHDARPRQLFQKDRAPQLSPISANESTSEGDPTGTEM